MIRRRWARRIATAVIVISVTFGALARLGLLRPSRIVRVSPVFERVDGSGDKLNVAILSSTATARCLSIPERDRHVAAWRRLLGAWGVRTTVLDESALSSRKWDADVLVLPATLCLDDSTLAVARDVVRRGGGVVATWAAGARTETGAWRGYEFLEELTGAQRFDPLEDPPPWFLAIGSGTPLGVGDLGATRLQIHSFERLRAVAYSPDLHWCDDRLFPRDATQPAGLQAAALHREDLSGGRVVWLGFHEDASVASEDDARIMDALLRNAVDWAGHVPRIEIAPWAYPYRAAAVISLVIDDQPENALGVARALLSVGGRATCISSQPFDRKGGDEQRHAIRAVGETMLAASSDDRGTRLYRLALTNGRALARWPTGLYGPVDPTRIPFGFDHAIAPPPARTLRPQILEAHRSLGIEWGRDSIVMLALSREERELSPLGLTGLGADWLVRRLASDLENVIALEGLFVFACRTQGLGRPEYAGLWPLVWDDWRSRGVWVTTADDVARWWRARDAWGVRCERVADRRYRVRLSSELGSASRSLVVRVLAPSSSASTDLLPLKGAPAPGILRAAESDLLVFEHLEPGRHYEYDLRYETGAPGPAAAN